jgi:hypothetical protein
MTPTPGVTPSPEASLTPPCETQEYCILAFTFPFSRPIASQYNDFIDKVYRFGSTMAGERPPHHGVEIENPSGTPVLAALDGTVVYAGNDLQTPFSPWPDFYGNLVILEHDAPFYDPPRVYSLYAHLSSIEVEVGNQVAAGQKVGEVGLTGSASGSHLHFEIRAVMDDYDSVINPELFLVPHWDAGISRGVLAIRFAGDPQSRPAVEIHLQYYADNDGTAEDSYLFHTYEEEAITGHALLAEDAALGDLIPGWYRITFILSGILVERWVEIAPEKLTLTEFQVP